MRGQGADKPPVVVLLDGDEEGIGAKRQFKEDQRLKRLVASNNVLDLQQIGEGVEGWPRTPAIEDLAPVPLAHCAMQVVLEEVTKFREGEAPRIDLGSIEAQVASGGTMVTAINRALAKHGGRVDKIAFAKALVSVCRDPSEDLREHVDVFLERMRRVFRAVNEAIRRSTEDEFNRKLETLVVQRVELFGIDNPDHATREQANIVLRQIETQLDDSAEAEAIRNAMVLLRKEHGLQGDPAGPVARYDAFLEDLRSLKHADRAFRDRRGASPGSARGENEIALPAASSRKQRPAHARRRDKGTAARSMQLDPEKEPDADRSR